MTLDVLHFSHHTIMLLMLGTVREDYAKYHVDPGSRMGDSIVMLSPFASLRVNSAKHLAAQRDRPFAAARGDSAGADFITRLIFETALSIP